MMWQKIQDINYEVSESGLVRNDTRKNVMTPYSTGNTPYLIVSLEMNGRQKMFSVHRLVAKYFVDNPNNLPEVNHLDGNKLNNHYTNLKWVTRSENMQHMYDSGLKKYKPLHYKGKFGDEHNRSKKVRCIETGLEFGSMSEAGRILNIDFSSVSWSVKHKKAIYGMHFEIAS